VVSRLNTVGGDGVHWNNKCLLTTSVYRKPTDTGLLLHYHSHVDHRYKKPLLNTMLNRAYHPSSTRESFTNECEHLKRMFTKLKYPANFVNSAITTYKNSATQGRHEIPTVVDTDIQKTVRITLPFKEQKTVCIINVWGYTEILPSELTYNQSSQVARSRKSLRYGKRNLL